MSTPGSRSRDSLSLPLMVEGAASRDTHSGRRAPMLLRDDLDGDELDTPMLHHRTRQRRGSGHEHSAGAGSDDDGELGLGAAASGGARHAHGTDIRKMWYDTAHAHSHVHKMTSAERERMKGYESLDYDTVQNLVYQRDRKHMDAKGTSSSNVARWLVFGGIGVLTGVLAYGLSEAVDYLTELKLAPVTSRLEGGALFVPFLIYTAISCIYVLIATALVALVEPVAGGSGIPEIKAYLNGTNYLRFLRLKTLVVKAVGVCFAVAGGLAIGKEGPLVHSGAVIAANLSSCAPCHRSAYCRRRHRIWLHRFRNDRDKRDFVSGGAGAGVAAAFGAPVGGILFSLEEAASFWSVSLTWLVFLAAMLSTFALNLVTVEVEGRSSFEGLISFGPPLTKTPYQVWETPLFVLLAVVGGLVGALFNHINAKINKWRRDRTTGRPFLRMFEAVAIAAITAVLAFWAPYFLSKCHLIPEADKHLIAKIGQNFYSRFQCPEGQYNSMASMEFATTETSIRGFFHNTGPYDYASLAAYFAIIFVLAVVTYGTAVPSGLFVPCILCGCAYGRLLGEFMRDTFPDAGVIPGTYALIGATSALGGVSRMTISLTVILLETTNDVQFIMPIMITLMISKWVGDCFNISLYDLCVELKCFPFVESAPTASMYHLCAEDVMQRDVVSFREVETAGTLVDELLTHRHKHNGFPVVTLEAPHRYVGMVTRNQLAVVLRHKAFGPPAQALPKVSFTDFATSLSSKHKPLRATDVSGRERELDVDLRIWMNPVPISVQLACPLPRVYTLFRSLGIRHLVVVDKNNELQGIITRKEIMSSFNQDLF